MTFALPYTFVNGTVADATQVMADMNLLLNACNQQISRDGSSIITSDIPFAGFKLTGLGSPIIATDAATKGYADAVAKGGIPSAAKFGALGDGSDQTVQLQAFLNAGGGYVSAGVYLTTGLVLPAGGQVQVFAHPNAVFMCATTNMAILSGGALGTTRTFVTWTGGSFVSNGMTGCRGLDLVGVHIGTYFSAMNISGTGGVNFSKGIYLRQQCWGLFISTNYISRCDDGIWIEEGANTCSIVSNVVEVCTNAGIMVTKGVTYVNVGVTLRDNITQACTYGIRDQAKATLIDGGYCEACSLSDIFLDGSVGTHVNYTFHGSVVGPSAVKARNAVGVTVRGLCVPGGRTVGIFDFDATNSFCNGEYNSQASGGAFVGIVTELKLKNNLGGTPELGDIGIDAVGQMRAYAFLGGTLIDRPVQNNMGPIAIGSVADTAAQSASVFYEVVADGTSIATPTNMVDGQTVEYLLKFSGVHTIGAVITVAGTTLDMTNAVAGARKIVRLILNAADANHVWVNDGPWK